jgi:hypothetical protein
MEFLADNEAGGGELRSSALVMVVVIMEEVGSEDN